MIFILILYNLILLICSPAILCYLLWRLVISGKSRKGFRERMGFIPARKLAGGGSRIWLHAVSVGETGAAKPIWSALLSALPGWSLFHSTTTDGGQAQAIAAVGEQGQVIYFPFDFLPCVWLALHRVRPSLIVLVETELWPNFLAVAHLLRIKVMLVNGRISDRSLRGAKRFALLYRWMTANIDGFCMQSDEDAARIMHLGADPARVTVMGNSKFDVKLPKVSLGEQMTLRKTLSLTRDEPVLLAGCTHPGEEEIVLRAFRQVKTAVPRVRLIIAPRHIQRAQEVEELVVAHGFSVARRTKLASIPPPPDAVIILDTIGELARAYALCAAAFVGGSFVPIGGHNVLEPLASGRPVLFGPYMSNFRDIAVIVQQAGVGFPVADDAELAAQWKEFLNTAKHRQEIAKHAAKIFKDHQGSAQRCAEVAKKLVSPGSRVPSPSYTGVTADKSEAEASTVDARNG